MTVYNPWGGQPYPMQQPYYFNAPPPQQTQNNQPTDLQIGPNQGYAENRSGIEPGTEWDQPYADAAGSVWDKVWGGIEGETRRVHGDDLTIGQTLLGGSTSGSKSTDYLYQPQDQFNQSRYYPYLNALYDTYGSNPSQLVAGFDPFQTAGQNLGAQNAYGLQGAVNNTFGAYGNALNPNSSFNSPLYQNALQSTLNPILRNFQQNVVPSIGRQAAGVGQPGSSRQGVAEGIASQGLMQNISDIGSQYAQNAFNQGINSRNQALGQASQLGQFSFMPSQGLMDIGAQRQGLNQQYLNSPFDFAARLQALMGNPITLNQSQSKSTSTGGVAKGFSDVFGGAGGMFGGF